MATRCVWMLTRLTRAKLAPLMIGEPEFLPERLQTRESESRSSSTQSVLITPVLVSLESCRGRFAFDSHPRSVPRERLCLCLPRDAAVLGHTELNHLHGFQYHSWI